MCMRSAHSWLNHPFVTNRFLVKDAQTIQKIASAGIREVVIDTSKGDDLEELPIAAELSPAVLQETVVAKGRQVSVLGMNLVKVPLSVETHPESF